MRRLQAILETILLRRTKELRVNNVPIISLPPRTLRLRKDNFMAEEADFYQALWENAKTKFNKYVQVGTVLHNYAHILELLLRLRQACDHPNLVLPPRRRALLHGPAAARPFLLGQAGRTGGGRRRGRVAAPLGTHHQRAPHEGAAPHLAHVTRANVPRVHGGRRQYLSDAVRPRVLRRVPQAHRPGRDLDFLLGADDRHHGRQQRRLHCGTDRHCGNHGLDCCRCHDRHV